MIAPRFPNREPMKIRYETILPLYFRLWKVWREKRHQRFAETMAQPAIGRMLDVGGCPGDWHGRGTVVHHVDCLNLVAPDPTRPPPDSPSIASIQGDGRHLPFEDASYEVVYSNSVIEHVGNHDDQAAFAREILRVGRRIWVQTPAWECPVEPHYLGLFVHWIPAALRWPFIRWTTVIGLTGAAGGEGLRNIMRTTRLLRKREFAAMFPGCEIWTERLFWIFPKSHVAIRR